MFISVCWGLIWNFTRCAQQQLLSITWEIVIRDIPLAGCTACSHSSDPLSKSSLLYVGVRLRVLNSCMAALEQGWFWGCPQEHWEDKCLQRKRQPSVALGTWGRFTARHWRGWFGLQACCLRSNNVWVPSPLTQLPWACRAPKGIRALNVPRCGSRHWGGSSSGYLSPGSWIFLYRRRWPGYSCHPSPHSPWAFSRVTEEGGGVWALCRVQGWSRAGRGLAQASGQGRRAQQAEVWLRKKTHYVNHWWLMFIDEREPQVVSLSLVDSSAIVPCLGWPRYSLPWKSTTKEKAFWVLSRWGDWGFTSTQQWSAFYSSPLLSQGIHGLTSAANRLFLQPCKLGLATSLMIRDSDKNNALIADKSLKNYISSSLEYSEMLC